MPDHVPTLLWCSSQLSLTGHRNRGINGVFELVCVVGRDLVSIAVVHAIVAGAQLAQGKPEMARNRFGFLERHEYSKEMPQGYSVSSADRCEVCRAGHVWRGRHIAPAHEGPRNESNNKAHEPTSGRSTRYGSGHLIRVFRDIGHIFSSLYPSLAVVFLSRFASVPGTCCFAPNICSSLPRGNCPRRGLKDEQWHLFNPPRR